MIPDFPAFADHIYIWFFGIILPFLSGLQSHQLTGSIRFDAYSRKRLYLSNSLMLSVAGCSVLILWAFKKRSFAALGFTNPSWGHYRIIVMFLFLFVAFYLTEIYFSLNKKKGETTDTEWYEKASFLPEKWKEMPAYVLLCLCAGIFEEIIYRGLMVTYFMHDNPASEFSLIALIAPAVLFSLAHFYQGWTSIIKIFIFTLLLNYLFIATKSLYPTILVHFLVDLISGMSALKKSSKS